MLETHDGNPTSVITGSSTHNERMERMWRNIRRCASSSFIELFLALEADGVLDPVKEVDIFCLHFGFLPRINKSLMEFQGSWNYYPLSTEGNMSPLHLFLEGQCASGQLSHTAERSESDADADSANGAIQSDTTTVETPSNKFKPCIQVVEI